MSKRKTNHLKFYRQINRTGIDAVLCVNTKTNTWLWSQFNACEYLRFSDNYWKDALDIGEFGPFYSSDYVRVFI